MSTVIHSATQNDTWRQSKLEPISLELVLPWYPSRNEEERFKRLLIGFIVAMLALMLVLTFSPVSDREKRDEKVVAKTKVLLEPVEVKPVEPEIPKPEPKPPAPPIEQPKVAKEKAQAQSRKVAPEPSDKPVSDGLSDVASQLSALRQSFDLTRNQRKNVSDSDAGKKEQATRTQLGESNVTRMSDGIEIDNNITLDEQTALAAHNAAVVKGADRSGVDGGSPVSRYAAHMSGERTMESIRYTLEKNKGTIFALYHQALTQNPNLSGKYTFELVIQPDGQISSLRLLSSELGDERLNSAILDRIRTIRFKEEEVIVARVKYTYTFIES